MSEDSNPDSVENIQPSQDRQAKPEFTFRLQNRFLKNYNSQGNVTRNLLINATG